MIVSSVDQASQSAIQKKHMIDTRKHIIGSESVDF